MGVDDRANRSARVERQGAVPEGVDHPSPDPLVVQRASTKVLDGLFPTLRQLPWAGASELRRHARVPIINIQHRCGLELDVSVGVTAQDTSDLVSYLSSIHPETFRRLSGFLKVFLAQLHLDKPFTGGLGSYKLYIMIGAILESVARLSVKASSSSSPLHVEPLEYHSEFVLLRFLGRYSDPANLNEHTIIRVKGMSANFQACHQMKRIRKAFGVAFHMCKMPRDGKYVSLICRLIDPIQLRSQRHHALSMCESAHAKGLQVLTSEQRDERGRRALALYDRGWQSLKRKDHGGAAASGSLCISYEEACRYSPMFGVRLRAFKDDGAVVGKRDKASHRKRLFQSSLQVAEPRNQGAKRAHRA